MTKLLRSVAILLLTACTTFAAEPLMTYRGDELTVHVLTLSDDDTVVTGEIVKGDARYPFRGRVSASDNAETVTGSFTAGGKSFDFSTSQREGENHITFTTGGQSYRLREVIAGDTGGDGKPPITPVT